ncbi:mitochondrial import receptor subunit TOM7 homolog [Entelurus aequoreus]|uniref:mitochondrial import receptor subunit TOM7 homolog n=1 Tax=Entelurus aequoreus TaxID=161455 RepID=UPI002B1E3D7D|nr:mitochondrial import receptor subunit TOM7 homolog [Entelurus aequoreus]
MGSQVEVFYQMNDAEEIKESQCVRERETETVHQIIPKIPTKISKETKQQLQQLFQCGQFVIRWGFIPTVLYLGFKEGADPEMPDPTVLSLLWG